MADKQPNDAISVMPDVHFTRALRRRRVLIGVGLLLSVVAICAAAIVALLQQLEVRNASFQPPMTASERQLLLPADPVLQATPQVEGIRYGSGTPTQYPTQYGDAGSELTAHSISADGSHPARARGDASNLQVDAHQVLRPLSKSQ